MTIIEAINRIDAVKPNNYKQHEKVKWLSALDGVVKSEIIDTHEGADGISFIGYDENTDINTQLLIPAPYDIMYIYWLEAQIDYHNGEMGKYNNSITMYNTAFTGYERAYNRSHMPRGSKFKFF